MRLSRILVYRTPVYKFFVSHDTRILVRHRLAATDIPSIPQLTHTRPTRNTAKRPFFLSITDSALQATSLLSTKQRIPPLGQVAIQGHQVRTQGLVGDPWFAIYSLSTSEPPGSSQEACFLALDLRMTCNS